MQKLGPQKFSLRVIKLQSGVKGWAYEKRRWRLNVGEELNIARQILQEGKGEKLNFEQVNLKCSLKVLREMLLGNLKFFETIL